MERSRRAGTGVHPSRWAFAVLLAFVLAMLTGIGLFVLQVFVPMEPRVVIHLILSVGFAAALLRFSLLERRAHKLG